MDMTPQTTGIGSTQATQAESATAKLHRDARSSDEAAGPSSTVSAGARILYENPGRHPDSERLLKINECFLDFGNDPHENINRLTTLCGELLRGSWAEYCYLEDGKLHSISGWHTPPEFASAIPAQGHLCADVASHGADEALTVRHLPLTDYAETDPTVRAYGLQTFIGHPVRRHGRHIGSICVVYRDDLIATESDKRLIGIIASAIGIEEERKKADAALREAYNETELILASLPSAILILNEDQQIVWCNSLAHRYFGREQESLIGSPLSNLLPDNVVGHIGSLSRPKHNGALEESWARDRECEAQKRIYRYRCFPVALRGGEQTQTGLVIWDVTEEKQLQDQLIQTEKLVSMGTMVSGMAHEINNPAQAILGMSELILEEPSPDTMKDYATDIVGYTKHIASVVRDFASYARSSSREGETELNLGELLSNAVKMVRMGPHFGHVEVATDFQPLPSLRARRTEIEQMFVNIISNAVQAMRGQGRLVLATRQEVESMVVLISDTGCGIPKDVLHKIFDPFFTTKDPGKGTGLGLSIVYRIVTKYGGKLHVESEEGRGTTFTIEFPRVNHAKGGASWGE